jgi:hypothetical protein
MKRLRIVHAAVGIATALAFAASAPLGASAAQDSARSADEVTIAGYSQDEFVRAAMRQGVDPVTARATWGDRDAMAAIPVTSVESGGRAATVSAMNARTLALSGQYKGTCQKWWNNLFGAEIMRLKINKQWYYDSNTLKNPTAQWYATTGFPYSYDGLVNSNDYYSTAYENPKGKHTTYRQGHFTENISGEGFNGSVTFVAKLGGTYSCSYVGGVN